ncbi:MAG: alkaline phosphatase family protein [Gemmatimonadota bacterium]
MRRVILLLVDGLRPDCAEAMLAAGELPHLAAMTARSGVARSVTVFPSTTMVAYLPFLTGCMPGTCNVPSIRWLDRARYAGRWWQDREAVRSYCGYQVARFDTDLAPGVPTIWELVPDSIGLCTPMSRGLPPERDPVRARRKWLALASHFFLPLHQVLDDVTGRHLIEAVNGPWRFIFAVFAAVDGYSHRRTPDAAEVRRAMRRLDAVVGRIRRDLAEREELDETLIVLVSDHGFAPVHTHLDLADWFRARDVPTLSHPVVWERAPRAAVMVAGNGSAMVYARPGRPRTARMPLEELRRPDAFGSSTDLIAALAAEPAIALLAAERAAGGIAVVSADGAATIERDGPLITYRPGSGDPLRLGGERRATADEWLAHAASDCYPDAAVQLLDQFSSPRAGDLLVAANEGFDLRDRFEIPEHRCGHGSLVRSHMEVPLWSSAPLPAARLRAVDLLPSMLSWLGLPVPPGIDGRLVWRPEAVPAGRAHAVYSGGGAAG